MARLKRSSPALNKAVRRSSGMRSSSNTLNFGDGLSLENYEAQIQTLQLQLSSYNTMLSTLDEAGGRITLMEQELNRLSEKMLMSVATRYGKDSLQYMQAGGRLRKQRASRPDPAIVASLSPVQSGTNGSAPQMMASSYSAVDREVRGGGVRG